MRETSSFTLLRVGLHVSLTGGAPLLYAFGLGLVAAFNPCGFPLLPAYLSMSGGPGARGKQIADALKAGLAVTLGFVGVFALAGLLIRGGVSLALGWVPWAMIPVGVLLCAVGIAGATGRLNWLHPPAFLSEGRSGSKPTIAMVAFGITYAIGSLTCALPIFLASVVTSFTHLGVADGLITCVAYAFGMGLVVTTVGLAGTGTGALGRMRAIQPVLQKAVSILVALAGAYLVIYWVSELTNPLRSPALVRVVENFQTHVSGWLTERARPAGIALGLLVLAALAWSAWAGRRPASKSKPKSR